MSAARSALKRGLKVTLIDVKMPASGDKFDLQAGPAKAMAHLLGKESWASSDAALERHPLVEEVLAHQYLEFVEGYGRVVKSNAVEVGRKTFSARRVIIATGSEAILSPDSTISDLPHFTEDCLPAISDQLQGVVVVGGGEYACLVAQLFGVMGIATQLVVPGQSLLEDLDPDVSEILERSFEQLGVGIYLGKGLSSTAKDPTTGGLINVQLSDSTVLKTSAIIATGIRRGRTNGLGLEAIGCATDELGFVRVNNRLQTSRSGIFCAGDVTGKLLGPSSAREMGRIAVSQAFDRSPVTRFDPMLITRVLPLTPPVATLGVTEKDAPGKSVKIAKVTFAELAGSKVGSQATGFVKLISAPRPLMRGLGGGKLIGATIVGPSAGEMISELALAMRRNLPVGAIVENVRPTSNYNFAVELAARQLLESENPALKAPAS
ncbi:MAG: NAD(P)/FAD-dependent oxidoreductase [Acidimicrobiaceae bacterium]|nr:NAD(P)/FAD-dependent oxidoreductase [Acidimicrobiaceae bacterium]